MCYDACVKFLSILIITFALLLGGCAAHTPTPSPAPTATATLTPTRTRIQASSPTPSATPDTTPPRITGISVIGISLNHMDIGWYTDEPATSQVEYGTKPEYGSITPLNESLTNDHSVTLGGLLPVTTYHFRVRSKDAAGNEAISQDKVQVTLAYTN